MPRIMNIRPTVLDTIIGSPARSAGCPCGCGKCGHTHREAEITSETDAETHGDFEADAFEVDELEADAFETDEFEADEFETDEFEADEFEADAEFEAGFRRRRAPARRASRRSTSFRPRRRAVRRRIRPRTAARANSILSRRLGWGRRFRRLAGRIGLPALPPSSMPLALAIARWQAARGLPPTGVLGPDTLAHAQGQEPADLEPPDDAAPADDTGEPAPEEAAPDQGETII